MTFAETTVGYENLFNYGVLGIAAFFAFTLGGYFFYQVLAPDAIERRKIKRLHEARLHELEIEQKAADVALSRQLLKSEIEDRAWKAQVLEKLNIRVDDEITKTIEALDK